MNKNDKNKKEKIMKTPPPAVAALNVCDAADFVSALADIFDSGRWVAEAVVGWRPFADIAELHEAMAAVVMAASRDEQLGLLQAAQGLDDLDILPVRASEWKAQLHGLNARFREHFGFPFIIARAADHDALLAAYTLRWENPQADEEATALRELQEIARLRLERLLNPQARPTGRLTVQVVETCRGRPAAGVALTLSHVADIGRRHRAAEAVTNADGECGQPLLEGSALTAGRYSLDIAAGAYFAGHGGGEGGSGEDETPFIDVITVAFGLGDPTQNIRLLVLISPTGYSVQRAA
jgi:2-oxo-4-hydroxy-4-carboxy-5-ureidoimidazoline decarboxylase